MPQKIDYIRIGSSVRDGIVRYTSVSQITNFDPSQFGGCNRRWWLDKIGRIKTPQTAAQDTGVQIHGQIETYLTTGEDVLGIVARAGMRFLPEPGPGLHVEMAFGDEKIVELFDEKRKKESDLERFGGGRFDVYVSEFVKWERESLAPILPNYLIAAGDVPILGAIDVINDRGEWLDDDGVIHKSPSTPEVIDWKTSSNIDQYAKTGLDLIETNQMIGYAKYASQRYPRANEIRISHGYFQTRGTPRAKKVSTVVPLDIIESRWQHIEQRVNEMKQIARETEIEKVPANLEACSAYRGCAFAAHCPRSAKTTILAAIKTAEKGSNVGLLDKLKSGQSLTAPAPAKPPTPATDPTIAAEIERLKAAERDDDRTDGRKPEYTPGPRQARVVSGEERGDDRGVCKTDGTPLTPENSSRLPSGDVVHIGCKPGVLPPDAPTSSPTTNAAPVPLEALAALPTDVKAIVEAHGATITATAPETATEKRGRGRPPGKKSENPGTTTGEATTRELFVDCVVKGRITIDLSAYIEKMCTDLATTYKAVDIRCAPSDSPLAFGKWKGALAAAIRENPPEFGTYVLYGVQDSEIRLVVCETLEPLCAVFVRGV